MNKEIRVFCSVFTCWLKIIICETTQHDIPEGHNLQTVTFCFCNMLQDFSHLFLVLDLIWHGSLEGTELHLHINSMPSHHGTYTTVLYLTVTHSHRNTQQSDIYTLTVLYSNIGTKCNSLTVVQKDPHRGIHNTCHTEKLPHLSRSRALSVNTQTTTATAPPRVSYLQPPHAAAHHDTSLPAEKLQPEDPRKKADHT